MVTRVVRSRRFVALLTAAVVIGAALRLHQAYGLLPTDQVEPLNMGRALAAGHGFTDPYFAGSGPSAHLLPIPPLIVALAYAAFGSTRYGAEVALQLLLVAETMATYLLAGRLAARAGLSQPAAVAATALLCLVPLHRTLESCELRYWDGALGLLCYLAMANLLAATRGAPGRAGMLAGALACVTAFISPPLGVAAGAALLAFAWGRPVRTLATVAAGAALAAAVTFLPWTLRNERVFHRPIVMRSNFGLELAIADDPASLAADDAATFHRRMVLVHPTLDGPGRRRYRRLGELGYFDLLAARTKSWIRQHPAAALALGGRHLAAMFIVDTEYLTWRDLGYWKAVALTLIHVGGAVGLAAGVASRGRGMIYLAAPVAVTCLVYACFHPVGRYLYLNYAFSVMGVFVLGEVVGRASRGWFGAGRAERRRPRPGQAPPGRESEAAAWSPARVPTGR